jgi:small-conductance mechanosensitive channel
MNRCAQIGYITVLAWLAIAVIEVFRALVYHSLPQDLADDVRARRRHTRTQLVRQIAVGLIVCSAFAAVLMTFPSIRNVGAGLFASGGLAGLVPGMAARPTLGNLIAGVQIALTEPIRIEDAVVVEGEFGRVVEMNTTYVIVPDSTQARAGLRLLALGALGLTVWPRQEENHRE